jgi:cation diffusion facilitator family transporter
MHSESLHPWRHRHDYLPASQRAAERRTRIVVGLTLVTMSVELAAGYLTGSMALIADGWHMGSHAAALGITAFAYAYARRHVANLRFSFGTGKVGSLAGYTSAVVLAVIALAMAGQSLVRLWHPVAIRFDEALWVACIGLAVNVACAVILARGDGHARSHERHPAGARAHGHGEANPPHHHDHNLRSAFLHVVADALTSVLAIVALAGGKVFGWVWLDPMMGLVGAALILHWSRGLMRDSGAVLLDAEDHGATCERIRRAIESPRGDRIADLHVWRVGPQSRACIVSLVTRHPRPPQHYKAKLEALPGLEHITVEVNACA